MIDRLVAGGVEVSVSTRSEAAETSATGAARAPRSLHDCCVEAEAVVVCVRTDDQVRSICLNDGLVKSMSAGSVLIVHTTGSPFTVRDIEAAAAWHGVDVVDAPVSGGPHDITAGTITTFVGGKDEAVNKARAVLRHYCDPVLHVGELGTGQLTKLVNNSVFASNVALLQAATRVGTQLGLDEPTLLRCLQRGSASSAAVDGVVRAGSSAAFAESVGRYLDKDVAVVSEIATELSLELGLLETFLRKPVSPS